MREPIERWIAKPFMKFYPSDPVDWWKGCVAGPEGQPRTSRRLSYLTLDEEGLYHRICNWMYLTGYDLPGDNMEAAKELHVNHNQYAVVLERLIYKGALIRYQGTVISNRVLKERIAFIDKKQPKTSAKAVAARERETKARIVRESPIGDTLRDLRKGLGAPEFADVIAQIEVVLSEYKSRENDPPSQAGSPPQSTAMTPPVKLVDPPSHRAVTPPVKSASPPQSFDAATSKIKELADAAQHKTVPTRAPELELDIEERVSGNAPPPRKKAKKKPSANDALAALPYTAEYETFWKGFPDTDVGMSKKDAWVAWQKLTVEQQQQATASLPRWRVITSERKAKSRDYTPLHAQGFLTQRRFESLGGPSGATEHWWQDPEKVKAVSNSQWEGSIKRHANGSWPLDKLGPAPGSKWCVVPDEVIDRLDLKRFYTSAGSLIVDPPWSGVTH